MIASIFRLDRRAISQLDIKDEYSIHRAVYTLFPGTKRSFLYYRYPHGSTPDMRILILSKEEPSQPEAGVIESKRVEPSFLQSERYAFRVRLNPIERTRNVAKSIIGQKELTDWFLKKESNWGFRVEPASLELQNLGVVQFQRGVHKVTMNECTFVGLLKVTDRVLFSKSFYGGIGRGKGFGFGLLQLQPIL
jgi:CRISPR system Cascade subunit CasE